MASSIQRQQLVAGEEMKDQHHQQESPSPRGGLRRTWSSSSSATCTAAPKCVCAPATHARSFKCRLHRVNSNGSHTSPPVSPSNPQQQHQSTY